MPRPERARRIGPLEGLEERVCLTSLHPARQVGAIQRPAAEVSSFTGLSTSAVTAARGPRAAGPRTDATPTLSQWMAQMPDQRQLVAPASRATLKRAWGVLWANTEPPGGAWTRPVITPGAAYADGTWIWDTGFHILGLMHGGSTARRLARWQIEVILNAADAEGRLPRKIMRSGPDSTGPLGIQAPGILTYAANRLYDAAETRSERREARADLSRFYPILAANDRWFAAHTDRGRGLLGWTTLDSGWDNSPRWDQPVREALDLNCWLYLDRVELAAMARLLGRDAEAAEWTRLANETRNLIQQSMWNADLGVFNDTLADGSVSNLITPVIVMPLWVGIATPDQAWSTLAHLTNPAELATPYGLASVAQNDPSFDPVNFWRGPVWINLNWMAIRAYQRYGYITEASNLRTRTLNLFASSADSHEYYNAQNGSGLGSGSYGWTASLIVDLAMTM